MAEDIAKETQQMLVEAWNKFFDDYYNKRVPEYPISWGLNEKEAKEAHWICWNEYDLMFHIGRLFYDILSKKKEEKFSNIEIHFEKNVNLTNFKDYEFKDRLDELKKNLNMKKGPKVDMIVAYEDRNESFLLCAEVKYFHSPQFPKTPIQKIGDDIEKLKAIRDCEIAKRVVFMLLDDYYWYTDEKTANDIKHKLDEIKKDEKGITVLSYSSEAKLEKYKQRM